MPIGGYLVDPLDHQRHVAQWRAGVSSGSRSDPFARLRSAGRGMDVHLSAAVVSRFCRLADHQRSGSEHQFLSLSAAIFATSCNEPRRSSPSSSSSITCWKCIISASDNFDPEHAASSAAVAIDRAVWVQVVYASAFWPASIIWPTDSGPGASPGESGPLRPPSAGPVICRGFWPVSGRRRSECPVGRQHAQRRAGP